MKQNESNAAGNRQAPILKQAWETLFGHKYWANVVGTIGTDRIELAGPIWSSRKAAMAAREQIESTVTFAWIETVTFRSREIYKEREIKIW